MNFFEGKGRMYERLMSQIPGFQRNRNENKMPEQPPKPPAGKAEEADSKQGGQKHDR